MRTTSTQIPRAARDELLIRRCGRVCRIGIRTHVSAAVASYSMSAGKCAHESAFKDASDTMLHMKVRLHCAHTQLIGGGDDGGGHGWRRLRLFSAFCAHTVRRLREFPHPHKCASVCKKVKCANKIEARWACNRASRPTESIANRMCASTRPTHVCARTHPANRSVSRCTCAYKVVTR